MIEELRKQLEAKLASGLDENPSVIHQGQQFLVFRVAEQELLIAVDDVREIIMPPPIAFLPRASREIEGVIALRGEIMPVVNLRRMLGFKKGALSPATRVLIVRPQEDDFGIIVDEITEFLWLGDKDIESVPQGYLADEFRVVSGVAKSATAVRPLLDVESILSHVFSKGVGHEKQNVQSAS